MALDPTLLEMKSMCYLPQQPWSPGAPDWYTYKARPPNLGEQGQETVSIQFEASQTDIQSPSLENPELFWLTEYLRANKRPESELEQLDDSETLASQPGTYSAGSTQSSELLQTSYQGNAFHEACLTTSSDTSASFGLVSDCCFSTSSVSQPESTNNAVSKNWLEDGSLPLPSPRYYSEPQPWVVSQQPLIPTAWFNELPLDDDRRHEVSVRAMEPTSSILTACSEPPMRHHRDVESIASIPSYSECGNQSFTTLTTEDVLPAYNYSSTQASRRLRFNGLSSHCTRQRDQVSPRTSVPPSQFPTLGTPTAWPLPLWDNDDGSLSPRTNYILRPNVQTRSRFAARSPSPESTRERVRQRRRPKDTLSEPVTVRGLRRSSRSDNTSSATTVSPHRRRSKDAFLVRSKVAGMSYKEIKARGHFSEAESTLRGRFRALTKNRKERVRKPEWTDRDVRVLLANVRQSLTLPQIELLLAAVEALTENSSHSRVSGSSSCRAKGSGKPPKIPWKQVADCIASRGGSYHFGNATCRKKWDEIQSREL